MTLWRNRDAKNVKNINATCSVCETTYLTSRRNINLGRPLCCSASCIGKLGAYKKHQKFSQTGQDNPHWKGGISGNSIKYTRRFRKKWPEKYKAHGIVSRAIKSGKLEKHPCEVCETMENLEAHHEDYSKPLNVRWLCKKHHIELHTRIDTIAA